jgi:hypothetical protein
MDYMIDTLLSPILDEAVLDNATATPPTPLYSPDPITPDSDVGFGSLLSTDDAPDKGKLVRIARPLWVCLAPHCESGPYKSVRDLDRHYKRVHVQRVKLVKEEPKDEDKDKHCCDYRRCARARDGFTRPERLRNHYRDFHREDLPKKGLSIATKKAAEEAAGEGPTGIKGKAGRSASDLPDWISTKMVAKKWWRCYTCLKRVDIAKSKFLCPGCSAACEPERVKARSAAMPSFKMEEDDHDSGNSD